MIGTDRFTGGGAGKNNNVVVAAHGFDNFRVGRRRARNRNLANTLYPNQCGRLHEGILR
jgi:hypothetical protein